MKENFIQLLYRAAFSASYMSIPILAEELGGSKTQIGIIGAVYGLALFTSSYLFGRACARDNLLIVKKTPSNCSSKTCLNCGAPGGIRTRDLRLSRLGIYKAAAITGLSHRGFPKFFRLLFSFRKIFFIIE